MKILLLFLAAASVSAGDIIFREDFDKYQNPTSLTELGWSIHSKPGHSTYTVQNRRLHVRITPNFRNDGYAEIDIPVCPRGQLDFDVCIDPDKHISSAPGLGLFLDIYNISTFWHNYCHDWRFYFPEPNSKRLEGFKIEPPGHRSIGKTTNGKWIHYRIIWDADIDRVEYYIDDMADPAAVKGDVSVLGRAEYQGGKLRIGSFGYGNVAYDYLIDNIIIRNLGDKTADGKTPKNLILLFQGMSNDLYGINKLLPPDETRIYPLDFWRSSYTAENTFKYTKLPGLNSLADAKTIILLDAPAGPGHILPEFLLKDIVTQVYAGTRLIIFGGLFTLDRGEFRNTPLEKIIPVSFQSQNKLRGPQPLPIRPIAFEYQKQNWTGSPCVYYLHDLQPADDVEILLKAGDYPLLIRRKYGLGEVLVFLGTTCGPEADAFWKSPVWSNLARQIILQ